MTTTAEPDGRGRGYRIGACDLRIIARDGALPVLELWQPREGRWDQITRLRVELPSGIEDRGA